MVTVTDGRALWRNRQLAGVSAGVCISAYLLVALCIYLVSLAGIRKVLQDIMSPELHRSAYVFLSECAVSPRERSKLLLSGS